jgi:hypothetical protein
MTEAETPPTEPSPAPDLTPAEVLIKQAQTGLFAVMAGDFVIVGAAIFALWRVTTGKASADAIVSIVTSAFTAVGTLTTAYFGIKATANTAQNVVAQTHGNAGGSGHHQRPNDPPPDHGGGGGGGANKRPGKKAAKKEPGKKDPGHVAKKQPDHGGRPSMAAPPPEPPPQREPYNPPMEGTE